MIYLATNEGLVVCDDDLRVVRRELEGRHISAVIADGAAVLAGTNDGIFRSTDGGQTWREMSAGLSQRHIRWMAFDAHQPGFAAAGTEPAGIFVSKDEEDAWREVPEVARLRDQHNWYLPYSPESGCVRGFAFHDRRAYAAVEVGGALRSNDQGANWRLVEGSSGNPRPQDRQPGQIHPDVHSIEVHPSSADLVFAPTGGGFYLSADGGASWRCAYQCYCRAAWVDPQDPEHIILGPADGVDRNGRVEESRDGGDTWQTASSGLNAPWRSHMVERFTQVGDELFAVLSNGEVFASPLEHLSWRPVLADAGHVNALAAGGP